MRTKILTLLIFLGIVNVFCSCEKTVPDPVIDPVVDSVITPVIKFEPNLIDAPCVGGELSLKYFIDNPVEGKILQVENPTDWVDVLEVTYDKVKLRFANNISSESREGKIILKYDAVLQEVPVIQQGFSNAPMIFKVQPSYHGVVQLPLWGNIDCFIDWGDGTIEEYHQVPDANRFISHTYTLQESLHNVSVFGYVESLQSFDQNYGTYIPLRSIVEVVDWGELGLVYMLDAFAFQPLEKIAEPRAKSFEKVIQLFGAFQNCHSLTSLPDNLFAHCPNVTDFGGIFFNCYSLTSIPENLFANCSRARSIDLTFKYCKSLTSIPENLFADCVNVTDFQGTFSTCSSLTSIPGGLFRTCPKVTDFTSTFENCESLTSIPVNLFDNNRKVQSFVSTFSHCYNLTGETPYTIIDGVKYHLYERENNSEQFVKPDGRWCFNGCPFLSDWNDDWW